MTLVRIAIALGLLTLAGMTLAAPVHGSHPLVIGSEQDYPPFAIGLTDDAADGFTVDLWKVVARDAGLDYRIRVRPFHQLLEEFKRGEIDVLINLAQSDERRQFADFTVPHVTVHAAIFTRGKIADIRSETDLKDKSVIVVQADIAHEYATRLGLNERLVLVPTAADGLKLLASGRHDAMLVSKLVGLQTLQQLELSTIAALPIISGAKQKFSFAVRKGDAELLALLNEGLALSRSSGDYATLYQKWFGIYEPKERTLQDMLKYFLPLLAAFVVFAVYVRMRHLAERQAQSKEADAALKESESRMSAILENVSAYIYLKDKEGRYLFANKMVRDLWQVGVEDIVGHGDEKFFDGDTAANIRNNDRRVLIDGETLRTEETNTVGNTGETATYWSIKLPLRRQDGEIYALCGISTDITEIKRAQEQMLLASMVYENSSEAMMVTDATGHIIAINPAFTATTGYSLDEIRGKNPRILKSGRHDPTFYQAMWHDLNTSGYWQGEVWDTRKSGEEYPKWLTINTTFNADGTPYRHVALFSDISEKKKSEQLIWQQANFDPLTGLPNRRMFHVQLEQELKKAHRNGHRLAVLFIDLDRFKEVNDSLGHDMGDVLLVEAAKRLLGCVRETDMVARLGGDEFTIVLGALEEIRGIDRIVKCILENLARPFALAQERAYISASVGITLYPDDADNVDGLLKNADQAMYEAKHHGRNRYSYFTQSMDEAAKERMRTANSLRVALLEKQFWIAYQPIVELATGAIHKCEALLRWQHPTRGLVSPAEFIPIAEETGIIVELGNWVFVEAVRQASQWRSRYDASFQISVNKSPVQFLNDGIRAQGWLEQMQEAGLPGTGIVVEITEGLLLHADPMVEQKLNKFRNKSMQIAIDDFGTGYSSLAYLKKFDIDYLKIDQTFVRNLASSPADLAVCEAIIVMAHKLGIQTIAEGVETVAQLDLLKAAGCDYAQGYYFSRPVAVEAFEKLLQGGQMD